MSSKRNFLANSIKPFMGLLGLSQSFSFFLAGEGGGGELPFSALVAIEVGGGPKMNAERSPGRSPGSGRGEAKSSCAPPPPAGEENSKRLKRSHRSGVRMASGWLGGRHISPTTKS